MISDIDVIGKSGRSVDDIMSTQVITISPDTELDEINFGRVQAASAAA